MAGPSNPVVDVQLWQEAIELKFQYTVEAHQLNYPSAADAVAVGAMMIPSHHQDAIYFFPMAVIAWAWGPIKEPAPAEELKLMVYAMTDHSKVDAHPCTHWFGIDVRTLVSYATFCYFHSPLTLLQLIHRLRVSLLS
jgi:hypothetical protein